MRTVHTTGTQLPSVRAALGFLALLLALGGLLGWGLDVDLQAEEDDAAVQAALRQADTLPPAERRAYAAGVRAALIAARETRDGRALQEACAAVATADAAGARR